MPPKSETHSDASDSDNLSDGYFDRLGASLKKSLSNLQKGLPDDEDLLRQMDTSRLTKYLDRAEPDITAFVATYAPTLQDVEDDDTYATSVPPERRLADDSALLLSPEDEASFSVPPIKAKKSRTSAPSVQSNEFTFLHEDELQAENGSGTMVVDDADDTGSRSEAMPDEAEEMVDRVDSLLK